VSVDRFRARWPLDGEATFSLQVVGLLSGLPLVGYLISDALFDRPDGVFLGLLAGGVGVLVLAYRRYGEPSGSRRNPGPDTCVLTREERVRSLVAGVALLGLACSLYNALGLFGVSKDSTLGLIVWAVPGWPALAYFWRALWGVDQDDQAE
jgi:hypothetical protein